MASNQDSSIPPQREEPCPLITGLNCQEELLQRSQRFESLGVLAGGVAHDLNNLLTGIFGYISLAKSTIAKDSDAAHNLDSAVAIFNSAKSLTQQLLTYVKGGSSTTSTISLSSLLHDATRFALCGTTISSEFDIPQDLWNCDAVKHQIEQVLYNILINARQAMPRGGNIAISARNVSNASLLSSLLPLRPYVNILIRDNGPGIPQDVLPRIFDPFFTTKQQGCGLGLATSFSIVKKHGGHISVDSIEHKGTTFSLFLPATTAPVSVEATTHSLSAHADHGKILILEDEEYIIDVSQEILSRAGYSVTVASHGIEAIDLYRKAFLENVPFDLVIIDLTIPGPMDGRQTMQELLKIDPAVKAIVSSGYSDDSILMEPHKYGFKDKLTKPFLTKELLRIVGTNIAPPPPPPPPLLQCKEKVPECKVPGGQQASLPSACSRCFLAPLLA